MKYITLDAKQPAIHQSSTRGKGKWKQKTKELSTTS